MRIRSAVAATALVVLGGPVASVQGEVVIETVTVGNPGNDGELSGASADARLFAMSVNHQMLLAVDVDTAELTEVGVIGP